MERFKRLGLQRRIMLYVAVGLVLMFGVLAFLGLQAISEATELVYQERLSTAYTTADILDRDFLHVARDVDEVAPGLLSASDRPGLQKVALRLLNHLAGTDPFPFFRVTSVWVLDPQGQAMAVVPDGGELPSQDVSSLIAAAAEPTSAGQFVVLPAMAPSPEGIPFATIAVPLRDESDKLKLIVAVHSVSINSAAPYVPTHSWRAGMNGTTSPEHRQEAAQAEYHLEVVNPDGIAILGIGGDENPGEPSFHFPIIKGLMEEREAAALLHSPPPASSYEPHVMAVVPLSFAPFYVVLEQPQDVALALPTRLRQGLIIFGSLGFLGTLLVAWITTRHVVKPTERLTAAAQRMAQGELDNPISIDAQDEVGTLAESLETMRQRLKAALEQIELSNRELEARVAERTSRLEEVLGKVISAQEEERRRLARELHDETAQALGALCITLDRVRDGMSGGSQEALSRVLEAKATASRLLDETRRLILDLRPTVLDDLGLVPAIRWYAESHLEEQGIGVTIKADPRSTRLPGHIEVALFRIAQEAISNAARHAEAKQVRIELARQNSTARLVVADDGRGFDTNEVLGPDVSTESIGLLGMQERVALLGGHMAVHSQPGGGTEVSVEIPLPRGRL